MLRRAARVIIVVCAVALVGEALALGQISSSISDNFSPALSDPFAPSSASDGYNTSFDAGSSNLTNTFVRTDISDPTHAMLDGSTISPVDDAHVNGYAPTQPRTQVLTDAQMAVFYGEESFGGRQSRAFAAGATSFAEAGSSNATSGSTARGGYTKTAFSGSLTGRAAFSSQSALSTIAGQAFSGDVSNTPVDPMYAAAESVASVSLADGTRARLSVDPVFANGAAGTDAGAGLGPDMPQPSAEAGAFFASEDGAQPQYQYDDGETPVLGGPLTPGRIIGTFTNYGQGSGGFSDSTKGMAGEALEGSGSTSPFPPVALEGDSPFRSFTDGSVYEMKQSLNPSLRVPLVPEKSGVALARARRAEQKRVEMGMSAMESEQIYREELRNARRPERRKTLDGRVQDTMPEGGNGSAGAAGAGH